MNVACGVLQHAVKNLQEVDVPAINSVTCKSLDQCDMNFSHCPKKGNSFVNKNTLKILIRHVNEQIKLVIVVESMFPLP